MHLLLINLKGDHTSHKGSLNRYSSVYYQLVITIWANGGSNLHMHNSAYYLIVMTKETAYILVGSILPTNHCFIGKLTATGWVW